MGCDMKITHFSEMNDNTDNQKPYTAIKQFKKIIAKQNMTVTLMQFVHTNIR